MTTYAVNLCDLSSLQPATMTSLLLADFASTTSPVVTAKPGMLDTGAVVLDGPAAQDEERAKAMIDCLQTVIGPRKLGRPIRCYQRTRTGKWKEIRPAR